MDASHVARRVAGRALRTPQVQRLRQWLQPVDGPPSSAGGGEESLRIELSVVRSELEALQDLWDRRLPLLAPPTFDDLTEQLDDVRSPPLDRLEVDESALSDDQRQWREQGYVLKRGLVPDHLLDAYWERRLRLDRPHGWSSTAPYMHVPEVLHLAVHRPLLDVIDSLIGEPMAVSLNLTGVVSTERNWHQDDYLNPPDVRGWYAAAWFAVGDIDPASGPFQFVPGSHRWPVLRRDRVRQFLTAEERNSPQWPRYTERFLDEILEAEIARRQAPVETFLGEKGDVLIWHSRLVHRGSLASVPGTVRRSFISHYTGVHHWPGSHEVGVTTSGGRYMKVDIPLDE
ncbi:MAG: phytanoyl-CoA dioxygenase family protein [Acidimicrobiales bacterium]|nr:phytanoyl-CoA dioxygenase family protein [Acidimicrobiales bacterium]